MVWALGGGGWLLNNHYGVGGGWLLNNHGMGLGGVIPGRGNHYGVGGGGVIE